MTRAQLEQLMRKEQQWCVSIYLPTHRTGAETQQNPIRLRNLLREAEKHLSARGASTRDVQKMLEPASKLLGDESGKNDLLRYFHLIEDGLTETLQGDRVPLVLAGVEYLLPIYKEANTYPNLVDKVIKGNPDILSADELHKSA